MFNNRQQAGQLLAEKILEDIKGFDGLIVLGIPRGGVVVAGEIAKKLVCPLDVIVVKKIGAPQEAELAIGAIGETNGAQYIDQRLAKDVGADEQYIDKEIKRLRNLEIKAKEKIFRQGKPALELKDKIVIIVDDGAATGATIIAACREVWNNNPKKVIIALPVVAKDSLEKLEKEADEVIFLETPEPFFSVGQFYEQFEQVSDEEVIKILQ